MQEKEAGATEQRSEWHLHTKRSSHQKDDGGTKKNCQKIGTGNNGEL
jgi:hypothetical protein